MEAYWSHYGPKGLPNWSLWWSLVYIMAEIKDVHATYSKEITTTSSYYSGCNGRIWEYMRIISRIFKKAVFLPFAVSCLFTHWSLRDMVMIWIYDLRPHGAVHEHTALRWMTRDTFENKSTLVQTMTCWRASGTSPLPEPLLTQIFVAICRY